SKRRLPRLPKRQLPEANRRPTCQSARLRFARMSKFGADFLDTRIMTFEVLNIESMDLDARGIARREGKVVFVDGALPGERVQVSITRRKSSYDTGRTEKIL